MRCAVANRRRGSINGRTHEIAELDSQLAVFKPEFRTLQYWVQKSLEKDRGLGAFYTFGFSFYSFQFSKERYPSYSQLAVFKPEFRTLQYWVQKSLKKNRGLGAFYAFGFSFIF